MKIIKKSFNIRQNITIKCDNILSLKGDFEMKNMNRLGIEEFASKYFLQYKGDIRKVSYVIYDDKIEYLINNHYLYII